MCYLPYVLVHCSLVTLCYRIKNATASPAFVIAGG